jgi:hypothetical protein
MTESPPHRTNGHGDDGRGPVATDRWSGHAVVESARDATFVHVPDDGRPDDGRPEDIFVGGRVDTANETHTPVRGSGVAEPKVRPVPGRVHVSWRHALAAGVLCFAVWLLLDAPTLLRSAQESPLGTRRSVSMTVLRPIADVSDALGLSHIVGGANRAIGHTGNTGSGVLQVEGPPAHAHRVAPPHPQPVPPPVTGSVPTPATGPVPTTTAVTAPDGLAPLGTPTPSAPLRLLVVGDSLGIDFGQPFVNDLAATDVVSAVLDGHIDTGLSRPDYFDWQTELQTDLAHYQPQAVVVFIGANDPQSFVDNGTPLGYGTAAWNAAYGRRIATFMQAALSSGARVLWVGMPPMADPVLNAKMQTLNAIAQSQAALHHGVTYYASWPVLSDPQGHFAAFLPDASGNEVQIRDPDGTHIAGPGAQRLSQAAIAFMSHEWGLVL